MSIIDKLIGLGLAADLTETSWWTDAVFRGLTQEDFGPQDAGIAADANEHAAGSI